MEVKVIFKGNYFPIIINENDTVNDLYTKCDENLKKFPHEHHDIILHYKGLIIERNSSEILEEYEIKQNDSIFMTTSFRAGGYIDNLKEESKTPIAKKIGFDMNLIKRDELNINLIHFDFNLTNVENYKYFNNFKVDVVGGFYAMDDINIFKKFLQKISEKKISFLVVCSGSSAKEIIPICKEYNFIKEVIIFCMNYNYHKHFIDEYPGYIKKVTTSINELYDYLKKFYGHKKLCLKCFPDEHFQFYDNDIQMDKQIKECPIITKEEYDKCYFLVHRAYAYFFENFDSKNHSFGLENYKIIEELLNNLAVKGISVKNEEESRLIKIFKELKNSESSKIFVEKTIRKYTGESIFCYLFNRIMRNIEPGTIYLAVLNLISM